MGIYLFFLGAFDLRFSGEYNQHAQAWMASTACQLVGSLAMLSSEVSVFQLTYMTLEKSFSVVFPFSHHRASKKRTLSTLAVIWLLGFSLTLVPFLCKESFGTYYGRNGVCFPLQSDGTERHGARVYSTGIFLGKHLSLSWRALQIWREGWGVPMLLCWMPVLLRIMVEFPEMGMFTYVKFPLAVALM